MLFLWLFPNLLGSLSSDLSHYTLRNDLHTSARKTTAASADDQSDVPCQFLHTLYLYSVYRCALSSTNTASVDGFALSPHPMGRICCDWSRGRNCIFPQLFEILIADPKYRAKSTKKHKAGWGCWVEEPPQRRSVALKSDSRVPEERRGVGVGWGELPGFGTKPVPGLLLASPMLKQWPIFGKQKKKSCWTNSVSLQYQPSGQPC